MENLHQAGTYLTPQNCYSSLLLTDKSWTNLIQNFLILIDSFLNHNDIRLGLPNIVFFPSLPLMNLCNILCVCYGL